MIIALWEIASFNFLIILKTALTVREHVILKYEISWKFSWEDKPIKNPDLVDCAQSWGACQFSWIACQPSLLTSHDKSVLDSRKCGAKQNLSSGEYGPQERLASSNHRCRIWTLSPVVEIYAHLLILPATTELKFSCICNDSTQFKLC